MRAIAPGARSAGDPIASLWMPAPSVDDRNPTRRSPIGSLCSGRPPAAAALKLSGSSMRRRPPSTSPSASGPPPSSAFWCSPSPFSSAEARRTAPWNHSRVPGARRRQSCSGRGLHGRSLQRPPRVGLAISHASTDSYHAERFVRLTLRGGVASGTGTPGVRRTSQLTWTPRAGRWRAGHRHRPRWPRRHAWPSLDTHRCIGDLKTCGACVGSNDILTCAACGRGSASPPRLMGGGGRAARNVADPSDSRHPTGG